MRGAGGADERFHFCDATDPQVGPGADGCVGDWSNCACQQKNKPFRQAAPLNLLS